MERELAAVPGAQRLREDFTTFDDNLPDVQVTVHLTGYPETAVTSHGKCRAAETCPGLCTRPNPPAALTAGQTGSLATWRFDRFGNRITSLAQEVPFLANLSGPGIVRTQIIEKGDGSLEIRFVI